MDVSPSAMGRGRARTFSLNTTASLGRGRSVPLDIDTSMDVVYVKKIGSPVHSLHSSASSTGAKGTMVAPIPALFNTRPAHVTNKRGEVGDRINCFSNCIAILSQPDWQIYQYHVTFTPVIDSKVFRMRMISDPSLSTVFGDEPVFDGTIFYSSCRLNAQQMLLTTSHPISGASVELRIKLTNELSVDSQQCLTIFNLCNRKAFESLGYSAMGRNFYNPRNGCKIDRYGLEIWPGMMSSIRVHEDKLLLCCETSHKVLRTETVNTALKKMFRDCPGQFRNKAVDLLIGTSVLTRYNNKTYRVDDIQWDKHPGDTFQQRDGGEISYTEYYFNQYGITISDPHQPLLVSRSKKHGGLGSMATSMPDFCLIPELCHLTGLSNEMRANRGLMQELAKFTRVTPDLRVNNGRKYLKDIRENPEACSVFDRWNLALDSDLFPVEARVLPCETIRFGGNDCANDRVDCHRRGYRDEAADWSRRCRSVRILDPVPLTDWVMVFHEKEYNVGEKIFMEMKRLAPSMGIDMSQPEINTISQTDTADYLDGIQQGRKNKPRARIVVVVVPNDNSDRYNAIKKWCCLDFPIPSQVIQAKSVDKNLESVCSKILMQMNCKVGGSIWKVDLPLKTSMVIGYDAYHDSANKTMSVGAAVFSIDPSMTHWFSRAALHKDPGQLATNLTQFCKDGLEKFFDTNGFYPSKVFLFRDGVGDGQIPVVFKEELPRIRAAFADVSAGIKLAFIIVTKRTTLRFFESTQSAAKNPPPGTVVDNGITKSERYDFFMVPQTVRQGTVSPICYNVIYDDTELKPDHLQRLAYKLCHMYYNWQGTIRVPAPCQYAHKLAFLVAQSLHKPAHESLADKLFYL